MTGSHPSEGRPSLLVAAPRLGADSEPWLWRQVVGIERFRVAVLTARHEDAETYPVDGIDVRTNPLVRANDEGWTRWVDRARRIPTRNFYGLNGAEQRQVRAELSDVRPAVALCHFGHVAVRLEPLTRRLGIPLVVHFHGLDLSSSLRNRWYHRSLKTVLPRVAAAVAVGTHQRQLLLDGFDMPPEKVHLIPCGVPVDHFPLRPQGRTTSGPKRFIAVSRLVRSKGLDVSIRAFAGVSSSVRNVTFDIVGDGPERPDLEHLARDLGLDGFVRFHGSLPQAQVVRLLGESDVFVQHSRTHAGWVEGFGVSITEASATGLPVVVSDSGGIADQITEGVNGYLVPEEDVDAMSDRMRRLVLDDGLARQLGSAGRERAREYFDTPRQIRRLEQVLASAARSETGSSSGTAAAGT